MRIVCLSAGRGVVVTGRLERGRIKKGDKVQLIGNRSDAKGQIGSIEMFHKTVEDAQCGDQLGMLIKGVPQVPRTL